MTNVRKERGDPRTDPTRIKRITRPHYKQLDSNQVNGSDDTDKFFERHKFPKLTQEEMDHQDSPVSTEEVDGVVENLPR